MTAKKSTTVKSKMNIVNRAMDNFNSTDRENLEKFYIKVIREIKNDIADKEVLLSASKTNHERAIEKLNERLEDAKVNILAAMTSIHPDKLITNQDRERMVSTFTDNVNDAKRSVQSIEEEIERYEQSFKNESELLELEIEQLKVNLSELEK